MGLEPVARAIPRRGRGTSPKSATGDVPVADWSDLAQVLRSGEVGPFWLSVNHEGHAPHVRPVFASWAGSSFYFASKSTAAKTARLRSDGDATISVDLADVHLVVEGHVTRVTDAEGPPYQVHELTPARAYAFPTKDQVQPTRWTFERP